MKINSVIDNDNNDCANIDNIDNIDNMENISFTTTSLNDKVLVSKSIWKSGSKWVV